MSETRLKNWINGAEIPVCIYFNRSHEQRLIRRVFSTVSWLGDGLFWYSIILLLPFVYGFEAWRVSVHMLLVGAVALLSYKLLKQLTVRPRPYAFSPDVKQVIYALDLYSFPSGHTMHAICFSTVLLHYFPIWAGLVLPFSGLVAVSRLILGLHYPSDVLVGGGLGFFIALASFHFPIDSLLSMISQVVSGA